MNDNDIFWSNCAIQALKHKLKDWKHTKLIVIWYGYHFHMLWKNLKDNEIFHFTHRGIDGYCSDLFFKGHVLKVDNLALLSFCKSNNVLTNFQN